MHPVLIALALFGWSSVQRQKPIRLEAEAGQLIGTSVSSVRPGFSGRGYVTGFVRDDAKVVLRFKAVPGIYEAVIRYSAPMGQKGFGLRLNGRISSGMFAATGDKFATTSAGKVELESENTLEVTRGWGYFDVDYVDLLPAKLSFALLKPPITLVDPQATRPARSLFGSLVNGYGSRTLSGQCDDEETEYIQKTAHRTPAIYGSDFIDYSPSRVAHGSRPKDGTEHVIARAKLGQIITMSWHWNAPTDLLNKTYKDANGQEINGLWYKGFYTNATTFDLAKALADPSSARYKLILSDIDAIAVELKKFSDAGIPILWRPLHEAEGGWFWWGAKGPKPFVALWRLMFDRLTRVHHLHNLIWVFTAGSNPEWYPGDAFVDILGVDAYPSDHSDSLSSTWEDLKRQYDGKKLLAISEFGGVPDIPRMRRFGVEWAYFVSWSGGIRPPDTSPETLGRIYQDKSVQNK